MNKTFNKAIGPIAAACALATFGANANDRFNDREFDEDSLFTQAQVEYGAGLILKRKDTNTASKRQAMASQRALDVLSAKLGIKANHKRFNAMGSQIVEFKAKQSVRSLDRMATKLMASGEYEFVETNRIMRHTATTNDPSLSSMWGLVNTTAGINAQTAWDDNQGAGVTVAVLDTGYRPHADLAANLIGGYDFITSTTYSNDGDGRDADAKDPGDWTTGQCGQASNSSWHGTHVAGTIAAVGNNSTGVVGVAYKSKIVPIRVLGTCGGTTADIADAMIWAAGGTVSGVPANPNPAKVINLSLGGSGACSSTTQAAINSARANGAVIAIASGNSNANVQNYNPGNCDGIISVASITSTGARSSFSNYGALIDIAAPGSSILSTMNSGTQGPGSDSYKSYSGTSMATPHVAGVAALMLAKNPALTPDEVEAKIKSSARSFVSSTCTTSNCGDGMLDAAAAVAAAGGTVVTPPTTGDGVLTKGVAKTSLSGAKSSEQFFTIEVPAGATGLSFTMSGGTGDADLYTRKGAKPTTASGTYDCRPYKSGNSESCSYATPAADTYHVMIRAYSAFSGVSLVANYTDPVVTPPGGASEFTNNANVSIYDDTTVSSSVNVTGRTSAVGNIDIVVDIKHTYIGDLEVKIIAPDGKSSVLHNRSGGSANDIKKTYSISASAVTNNGNGTWKLQVNDNYRGDTGYIDTWTLKFK